MTVAVSPESAWIPLRKNNVNILDIMNAIDHLYDLPDLRASNRNPLRTTHAQDWTNIPQDVIDELLNSMPRRVQSVIQASGGYTRY